MFDKKVSFNLIGAWYVGAVLETLSVYRHGIKDELDLKIVSCYYDIGTNIPTFVVQLRCKEEELTKCLNDILRLSKNGVTIDKLHVK